VAQQQQRQQQQSCPLTLAGPPGGSRAWTQLLRHLLLQQNDYSQKNLCMNQYHHYYQTISNYSDILPYLIYHQVKQAHYRQYYYHRLTHRYYQQQSLYYQQSREYYANLRHHRLLI
jgi:hypothetical protein